MFPWGHPGSPTGTSASVVKGDQAESRTWQHHSHGSDSIDMRSTRVRLLPRFPKLAKARTCGAGLDSWKEVLRSFHSMEGKSSKLQ